MPMDRLMRGLAAAGLALTQVVASSGCRSTKTEVPPGRARQPASVGFSANARPTPAIAAGNVFGGGADASTAAGSLSSGGSNKYGTPPTNTLSSGVSAGEVFAPPSYSAGGTGGGVPLGNPGQTGSVNAAPPTYYNSSAPNAAGGATAGSAGANSLPR